MDVVIPTNLVRILFDPTIPTSSFNLFNCFYTCIMYDRKKISILQVLISCIYGAVDDLYQKSVRFMYTEASFSPNW